MTFVRRALLVGVALLAAGCSSGAATSTSPASDAASQPAGVTRIEVALTDALRFEPATMTVPAGVPVTFVITNTGATDHEFYIGDEAAQDAHAKEMASMGGMMHDEPEGIGVRPGASRELTYTFANAGQTLAGCHVAGHYAGGMKATINVSQ